MSIYGSPRRSDDGKRTGGLQRGAGPLVRRLRGTDRWQENVPRPSYHDTMRRTSGVIIVSAALLLATSACTYSVSSSAPTTPPVTAPVDASDLRTPASGESQTSTDVCEGAFPPYPVSDPSTDEQLGGASLAVPHDRGPMPNATGSVVADSNGTPVAYVVADNDVLGSISARLCVSEHWISWVNSVRRSGDAIFAGDTLNLDAHTIYSVGDQNGAVHNNSIPTGFKVPPQR